MRGWVGLKYTAPTGAVLSVQIDHRNLPPAPRELTDSLLDPAPGATASSISSSLELFTLAEEEDAEGEARRGPAAAAATLAAAAAAVLAPAGSLGWAAASAPELTTYATSKTRYFS